MTISCQALIFDFDGVLVDSNPIAERHWARWARKHEIPEDNVLSIHHGRPSVETIRAVAPHLDAEREAKVHEQEEADDTEGLTRYPGVMELISILPPAAWGIATSGRRRTATFRMAHVGIPMPRVLVTADDVSRGKPDPEPYLLAASRLGVAPTDCVVIEDAPAGIASAKGAGAYVIAVETTNNIAALSEADCVVKNIEVLEMTVAAGKLLLSSFD